MHETGIPWNDPSGDRLRDWLGVDRDTCFRLAYHPTRDGGVFHMTAMAIRLSRYVNGVSRTHERETRRIWTALWPGRDVEKIPIGCVTNGAHLQTWMAHPLKDRGQRAACGCVVGGGAYVSTAPPPPPCRGPH